MPKYHPRYPATVEKLKKAKMRAGIFADASDYWVQVYQCIEYPEITKVVTGPRGNKSKVEYESTLEVHGNPAPKDLQDIADMINEKRRILS